jgi:nicotinate-nucleotide adenylyltransferase
MTEKAGKTKLTGLFFGSFNPIHSGHLIIANYMLEWTDMEEVWFIVSPRNPLKEKQSLLADKHRLALVRTAIEDHPKFRASNIEFGLPQPSYTIHTLEALAEKYPNKQFALIMGADNLATLKKWKNYSQILEHNRIYVYPRPGTDGGEFLRHPHVVFTSAPLMEISSTFIRESLRSGKSVKYLLPENVNQYISDMHFYEK